VSGPRYRLTELADDDIKGILAYTLREFGPLQLEAYAKLIDEAAQMVGQSPMRPGSKARDELEGGVRSFHVELAAPRRGAASHVLYYVAGPMEDGTPGAIVLRVLWQGMDPKSRVMLGLDELKPE
jgi:toxin ParE1/3/4